MSRKRPATVLDEQSAAVSATIEAVTPPIPIPAADQVAPAASISAQSAASLAGGAAALPAAGFVDACAVAAKTTEREREKTAFAPFPSLH